MSQHVALLLDLGVLKKLFAGFRGGQLPPPPFFSASYDHVVLGKNSPVLRPNSPVLSLVPTLYCLLRGSGGMLPTKIF